MERTISVDLTPEQIEALIHSGEIGHAWHGCPIPTRQMCPYGAAHTEAVVNLQMALEAEANE